MIQRALLIILILAVGFLLFSKPPQVNTRTKIITEPLSYIQEIKISTLEGSEFVSFERRGTSWQMIAPEQVEVNDATMSLLLDHLYLFQTLNPVKKTFEETNTTLSDGTLIDLSTSTESYQILIGSSDIDRPGSTYIRYQDQVYSIPLTIGSVFSTNPDHYRATEIVAEQLEDIMQFAVVNKDNQKKTLDLSFNETTAIPSTSKAELLQFSGVFLPLVVAETLQLQSSPISISSFEQDFDYKFYVKIDPSNGIIVYIKEFEGTLYAYRREDSRIAILTPEQQTILKNLL